MFLIRYERAGEDVYVTGPHFGRDVYSYTYSVADAALWATVDAAASDLLRHGWPNATIIPFGSAEDVLPERRAA